MALLSPMGIFGFDVAVAYRGLTCGWQRRGGVYPHPNPLEGNLEFSLLKLNIYLAGLGRGYRINLGLATSGWGLSPP